MYSGTSLKGLPEFWKPLNYKDKSFDPPQYIFIPKRKISVAITSKLVPKYQLLRRGSTVLTKPGYQLIMYFVDFNQST